MMKQQMLSIGTMPAHCLLARLPACSVLCASALFFSSSTCKHRLRYGQIAAWKAHQATRAKGTILSSPALSSHVSLERSKSNVYSLQSQGYQVLQDISDVLTKKSKVSSYPS
jgi:hypothetical protein